MRPIKMTQAELDAIVNVPQIPGLAIAESELAKKWLREFGRYYDRVEFNVRVGQGAQLPAGLGANVARGALLSTQKRIDIVGHAAGQVDLVETKQRASLGGIGQLLGYAHLWTRDHPGVVVGRLYLVSQQLDADAQGPAMSAGIIPIQYPNV